MKISHLVQEKYHESIKKNAQETGLDRLTFGFYSVDKLGTKEETYIEPRHVISAEVTVLGDDEFVWILASKPASWFKTSPVVSCVKTQCGFEIETKNSFYRLEFMQ